jgi:hypothetical protein
VGGDERVGVRGQSITFSASVTSMNITAIVALWDSGRVRLMREEGSRSFDKVRSYSLMGSNNQQSPFSKKAQKISGVEKYSQVRPSVRISPLSSETLSKPSSPRFSPSLRSRLVVRESVTPL